ncbi:MAG: hypothetical protein QOG48_939 [Verrucomicrobiota bacterium]|jgi:MFS family permease
MRILRALGIAFLTGIVGMLLAFFAADQLTRLYHVSDFEGQRAMGVVFIFSPLGFIAGFVVGFISAVFVRGFFKAQSLSIFATIVLVGIVSGIAWLGSDRTPEINGKNVALEFEWKIPPAIQMPPEPNDQNLYVSLYASRRDHHRAELNFKGVIARDGVTIVPGRATLLTRSANRQFLAAVGDNSTPGQLFSLATLAPSPRAETDWSDWITAENDARLKTIPESERTSIRYRVRVVD